MSKSERNMLKYLAIAAVMPHLMRKKHVSKTVEKMLVRIDSRVADTLPLYPELILESKDCNRIEKEVYKLQSTKRIHIACLSSICLAGFDDGISRLKGKRKIAVTACLAAVKRLHDYFDRNLNLTDEYMKAEGFI